MILPVDQPGVEYRGTIENVSAGGMLLHADIVLPLYAEFEARIYPDVSPAFRARARVVHCTARGIGCCFSHLTAQARLYLDLWLGRSGGLPGVTGEIDSGSSK
jgi:hypothetical protein